MDVTAIILALIALASSAYLATINYRLRNRELTVKNHEIEIDEDSKQAEVASLIVKTSGDLLLEMEKQMASMKERIKHLEELVEKLAAELRAERETVNDYEKKTNAQQKEIDELRRSIGQ